MKEVWVLSVKTSLPDRCHSIGNFEPTVIAFDSFEKGREVFREIVRKWAFSENSMFDGNGYITYLKKYADKGLDDDDCYEDCLSKNRLWYVMNCLRDAISGKDVHLEMEGDFFTDWMIGMDVAPENVSIYGVDDGPFNGFDPCIRTNMFSMAQPQNYYLYINDRLGQFDCSSELYVDMVKAEVK